MAEMKKKSTILKDTFALTLITVVAGLALGFVFELTKGPIAQREMEEKTAAYEAVYAESDNFGETEELKTAVEDSANILSGSGLDGVSVNEAYVAYDKDGNELGYVMSVSSSKGFNGEVTLSLGVSKEGEIKGIEFLVLNETKGLGSKAADPEFKGQYVGKSEEAYEVVKGSATGNQINAISGATVTSEAVTSAINAAIYFINNIGGQ